MSCAAEIAANHLGGARWILKISADGFLHLLAGIEQPEHDEQRHHRGHEVCVRNLPGSAVMSTVT